MPEIKTVTIADRKYHIPELPLKVMKRVIPKMSKLIPVMAGLRDNPFALEEEHFDLMVDIIHAGIEFGTPGFKKEVLLDDAVSMMDLSAAVIAVMEQCGAKPSNGPAGDHEGKPLEV